jgi:hypothetical protein
VEAAREQNSKLAEELEDCMMELRAWQEENRRVRKMLAMAQGMKDAGEGPAGELAGCRGGAGGVVWRGAGARVCALGCGWARGGRA